MTAAAAQRASALERANERRRLRARVRRDLLSGALLLDELMVDPPACLESVMLVEVLKWFRRKNHCPGLTRLGQLALRDGVNLLQTVGGASTRSRAWVAEHGTLWTRR